MVRAVLPALVCISIFFAWLLTHRWHDVTALDLAIILLWSVVPLGGIALSTGFILHQRFSVWRTIGNVVLAILISYPIWWIGWMGGLLIAHWLASKDIAIDVLEMSAAFTGSFVERPLLSDTIGLASAVVRVATLVWPPKSQGGATADASLGQ